MHYCNYSSCLVAAVTIVVCYNILSMCVVCGLENSILSLALFSKFLCKYLN